MLLSEEHPVHSHAIFYAHTVVKIRSPAVVSIVILYFFLPAELIRRFRAKREWEGNYFD